MVSLRHEIVSGDVVEILTNKGHTPSRDWLSFVKSSHARSKIRQWINLHEREEATEMGKKLLEKESRHFGRGLKKIPEADWNKLLADYGLSKQEDLYAAVGFGKYSARQVLSRLLGEPEKAAESEAEDSKPTLVKTVKRMLGFGEAPLIVKGHDDLLVYRAKCCNPIPGDDIVGYITRGRGVAVHTRACPNVQNLMYQTERRIAVEWGGESAATFPVQLSIRAKDRAGLLAEITTVISGAGSNIRNLESRPDKPKRPHRSQPRNCRPPPAGNYSRQHPKSIRRLRGRARLPGLISRFSHLSFQPGITQAHSAVSRFPPPTM